MTSIKFDKYQGAGNDFLVVEASSAEDAAAVTSDVARELCKRRYGIGGDGVLLVLPAQSSSSLARMRVINADGSVPEMCGNGLRCVALHLARKHNLAKFSVETDAGEKPCVVETAGKLAAETSVTIDMGQVTVLDVVAIDVDGESWSFTRANVGNPHAVTFAPFAIDDRKKIDRVGPFVATHPMFPHGTNVEFAREPQKGARVIDLVVWERGVGVTHACGTGACATVAVALARGLVRPNVMVPVKLPGGLLHVSVAEDGRATLEGPAAFVFSGSASIKESA